MWRVLGVHHYIVAKMPNKPQLCVSVSRKWDNYRFAAASGHGMPGNCHQIFTCLFPYFDYY